MFTTGWERDPWREFEELRERVAQLFQEQVGGAAAGTPALNIWFGKDDAAITLLVPGLGPDDVSIGLEGRDLVISGQPPEPEREENRRWFMRERQPVTFTRRVSLPFRADGEKIQATVQDGLLRIEVPRAEEDKPRRITVQAA